MSYTFTMAGDGYQYFELHIYSSLCNFVYYSSYYLWERKKEELSEEWSE
jgi:hypothetical protein